MTFVTAEEFQMPPMTALTAHEVRLTCVAAVRGFDFNWSMGDIMNPSDYNAAILLVDGMATSIPNDLYEYIRFEAERRNVSMVDIYREEMKAREELKGIVLRRDRLERAAQRDYSNHPWLQGEEQCPF
jgi:hypothetical protein